MLVTLRRTSGALAFAALAAACAEGPPEIPFGPPPTPLGEYELVWSDEFDYVGLPDPERWDFDVGGHGWGNQELQFYTRARLENARVENGRLIIEAHREPWQGREYTSARLVTRGKADWTYGRFEIAAKLPSGRGTWPAIWMLATNHTYGTQYWPDNGEIDIMEHVGHDPDRVHASIHTRAYHHSINTQKTAVTDVPTSRADFNVYAVEWTEDQIRAFVNDRHYFTFQREPGWERWPFDQPFHLLLNVAIGGWGGAQGIDDGIFPQRMEVEYVRVYQRQGER